ncbi:MAG: ABC transporter ATP-binding protein [Acidimicrobiales bacterium]
MSAGAVECAGVTKSYGAVTALRGADLSLAPSTLTAVLGPSGCGKTTLLRVIAGFERLDGGTVTVSGQAVAAVGLHLPPERRRVTIVPQEQALFPHLTVFENVGYGVKRGPERAATVEAMLTMAGLAGLGERMPHELSGGQQQRVALARALAPRPSVVLLDEPFGSLDAALRTEIRAEVAAVLRAAATTSLLVTHDQEEALSMAGSVAVMRDGVIVQHGAPDDVYRRPADLWVAGFVGSANVLAGRLSADGGQVACSLGILAVAGVGSVAAGGSVDVVVRPEQVRLAVGGAGGVIEDRQYFGHDALVRIVLSDGSRLLARLSSAENVTLGSQVTVTCDEPVLCFHADR